MKRRLLLVLLSAAAAILMLLVALYVPNSLPVNSDFSAIYNTDLALVHRIPIYDLARVEELAVEHSDLPREKFFLARFPYPPWYALSTFYLGLLPPSAAAMLWFELNLAMLFLSIWLLTEGWPGQWRLLAFPLALFFLPVLGALSIGQYDFPVLLGSSVLISALRRENAAGMALGALLLTFKPHIGALILLAVSLYLLIGSRSGFGRRAFIHILIGGISLLLLGFAADAAWILAYPGMLLNYQNEGNVTACSECASLPVWLSRWFLDGSLSRAAIFAVVLLVVLIALFFSVRQTLWKSPALMVTSALSITLLVSPYLYNYDFLLLLVPFAVLVKDSPLFQKILILLCYLIPSIALVLAGRAGNILLAVVTVVITALLYLHLLRMRKSVIDVPA